MANSLLSMSYFIINTAVANVYKEPSHKSAVLTQALLGESCKILDHRDKWYFIKQWDGYEGWMYYFYGIESNTKYQSTLVLQDIFGTVISPKLDIVTNIVFGCQLQAKQKNDHYEITLPDGRKGISKNKFGENKKRTSKIAIVETARLFLGTPYAWGGKTSYGMDCSGLVQTVFKANGIDLPRDAYQQADFFVKSKINEKNIKMGDLLFFGENDEITHVAIATEGLDFINARGFVQEESIDEKNSQFNRNLRNLFSHAISIKEVLNS
ncbi:MAG: C40 family peptidase [Candidatus Neomarinimicrobiota bacterium]